MALPLVTAAVALFYLGAVPLRLAFCLRLGANGGFGVGVAAFEGRFAQRRAALLRGGGGKKPAFLRDLDPLEALKSLLRAVRFLLKHLRVDAVELDGALGADDAALTALICGGLAALGHALRCATGREIRLNLRPDFSGGALHGELSGMISVRVGHIIFAALLGAFEYASGRLNQWISTPLKAS